MMLFVSGVGGGLRPANPLLFEGFKAIHAHC